MPLMGQIVSGRNIMWLSPGFDRYFRAGGPRASASRLPRSGSILPGTSFRQRAQASAHIVQGEDAPGSGKVIASVLAMFYSDSMVPVLFVLRKMRAGKRWRKP